MENCSWGINTHSIVDIITDIGDILWGKSPAQPQILGKALEELRLKVAASSPCRSRLRHRIFMQVVIWKAQLEHAFHPLVADLYLKTSQKLYQEILYALRIASRPFSLLPVPRELGSEVVFGSASISRIEVHR